MLDVRIGAAINVCFDCSSRDGLHPFHSEKARGPALVGSRPDSPASQKRLQCLVSGVALLLPRWVVMVAA